MTIRQKLDRIKRADEITVAQATLLSGYDRQTIYRKIWADRIPGVKRVDGYGHVRLNKNIFIRWAEQQGRLIEL